MRGLLAVMDIDARAVSIVIDDCKGFDREDQWRQHLAEHDAARLDAAELIEALREIAEVTTPGDGVPNVDWINRRAIAALSRVNPTTRQQQAEQAGVRG